MVLCHVSLHVAVTKILIAAQNLINLNKPAINNVHIKFDLPTLRGNLFYIVYDSNLLLLNCLISRYVTLKITMCVMKKHGK